MGLSLAETGAGVAQTGVVPAEHAPREGRLERGVREEREGPTTAGLVGFLSVAAVVCAAVVIRRGDLRSSRLGVRREGLAAIGPLVLFVAAVGLWAVWAAGGVAAGAMAGGGEGSPRDLRAHGIGAVGAYGVGLLAAALLWVRARPAASKVTAWPRWSDAALGVGFLLLALPLVIVVGAVSQWLWLAFGGATPGPTAHATLNLLFEGEPGPRGVWWWVTVAAAALAAPILEEIVYRGLLQGAMVSAMRSPWAGIIATSAVFALAHAAAAPPFALPTLFVLGLALGAAMERTGRLGVCIVMHAGFNVVNLVAAGLG